MKKPSERGSALFYILIAIALLAALSFAVARSNRGNVSQLSEEQSRLLATEMLEYANSISSGVAQVKLRGVKDNKLCFDDPQATEDYNGAGCSDDFNKIFSISGAGITWTKIPEDASAGSPSDLEWHVYGDNEIKGVGTTCAATACADLLLVATALEKPLCTKINQLLNITAAGVEPPSDAGLGTTPYIGAYGYNNTIGNPAVSGTLDGKSSACFFNSTNSTYVFYKTLIAR